MQPKTLLLIGHLIGLVLGLGGVVVLDTYLLRFLKGADVTDPDCDLVHHVSRLVLVGLALLWATGAGLLMRDNLAGGTVLFNPKVHAKLIIAGMLTLNGALLHRYVLPLFARQIGHSLFDVLGWRQRMLLFGCGAVSTASWTMAFILGATREFNDVIPVSLFLTAYGTLIVMALGMAGVLAGANGAARVFRHPGRPAANR